ncbi:hypothetical protein F4861DRAFT_548611 [Xylaria intraflava]|nr:hypothetical protein F4861DRAFT_548611 [Xylaria intraflava]
MMATAATVGGPVDVSVNEPSPNEPAATKPDFENVDRSDHAVNGSGDEIENKQIADIVDELVNSAEASVSGGSDTEAFKGDPSKSDEKGHARSSSTVKKPQSFKSVSVNRTFLASKSATSTSRPESAAGSASTTPQPTVSSSASRLKLVAKSGSNLGGASKTLSVNGKTGAPDPNLVWNRNRAPTQPEAKKRSDEELKHDGIHLADRLGPEDLKGQSNWADIDDDDEWAPDTITWTDGTKITLPPTEEAAPSPTIQPAVIDKPKKDPILVPKPKSPAPISSTTGSPSVKPGVLASGKGLVFKGAPEKPTLVAKPPPPQGPVKSPWATLPPVEKVSPVVMELPSQAPPSRFQLRDLPNSKSATPPPPTKEIAADDFSRNYRDGTMNSSRELYNSQSGRYEPVSDRRGSRHDIHARQPALLQRPAHNEQQGPAEPSAAFQTSRSSAQDGPYGRRRGSSNVSGGSGHLIHRIGGRPHDMPPPPEVGLGHPAQGPGFQPRAASIHSNADTSVPPQTYPPANNQAGQHVHMLPPYQPLVSPHDTHAVPYQNAYNQELPQADPDLEKAQKEYMRKKREEAVRRRMEEEQAEERAKQARIAEKLKALGPAPERKSAKKDSPSVVQRADIPASLIARSKAPSGPKSTNDPASATSPGSEPNLDNPATEAAPRELAASEVSVPNGSANRSIDYDQPRMPSAQSIAPGPHAQSTAPWTEASQNPDRFQTWTSGHQNTSRNVWGAPGNDRSLGNGTFNADIGPLSDSSATTNTNMMHRPALIAPPLRPATQLETQPNRLAPIGPPRAQPHISSAWKTFDIKADDDKRRLERMKQREVSGEKVSGPVFTDTWRPVDLDGDGMRSSAGTFAKPHRDIPTDSQDIEKATPHPEVGGQSTGLPPTGPSSQIRTGSRFFPASKDVRQHEASTQPSPRSKSPTPPPPTADDHPVYDGDATKPHVALPPSRPRVKLPPSVQPINPGPIAPPSKQSPVSFTSTVSPNLPPRAPDANIPGRPISRGRGFSGIPQTPHEIASQETWQSKINNLMGKKSITPPKAMGPGSSMTGPIEFPRSLDSMDVPILSPSGTDWTEDSSFTSKEMAEECFGEQEMGSLPAVRLPAETPDAAWQAVLPDWLPAPAKLRVEPSGRESFKFGFDYVHGKSVIRILTPGMLDAKTVIAPVFSHRSGSNPRRMGPRAGPPRHTHTPRGGRRGGMRDTLERGGEHGGDHSSASSSRAVSSRGPRSFRPRGESWTRQMPSASTTQS